MKFFNMLLASFAVSVALIGGAQAARININLAAVQTMQTVTEAAVQNAVSNAGAAGYLDTNGKLEADADNVVNVSSVTQMIQQPTVTQYGGAGGLADVEQKVTETVTQGANAITWNGGQISNTSSSIASALNGVNVSTVSVTIH